LEEGDVLVGCYAVVTGRLRHTKHGKPYLELELSDRHGIVEARVWDDAETHEPAAQPGEFIGVRARVELFRESRQLKVESLAALRVELDELALFMPASSRDPGELDAELRARIASVNDVPLRNLLDKLLGPSTVTGRAFRRAPAAKIHHHAYVGGLLEHTLSVTGVCALLAAHYGDVVDRDLLVAGALLHDIGKVREIASEPGFPYTDEGKLLGHIVIGLEMVGIAGRDVRGLSDHRLRLLLHLIASHQGRFEWQSPREPRTIEAILLHHADLLDARMRQALDLLGTVDAGWTGYDRSLGLELFRHAPGAVPAEEASVARSGSEVGTLAAEGKAAAPTGPLALTRVDEGTAADEGAAVVPDDAATWAGDALVNGTAVGGSAGDASDANRREAVTVRDPLSEPASRPDPADQPPRDPDTLDLFGADRTPERNKRDEHN
jgi:3'-5' exoribonuclease